MNPRTTPIVVACLLASATLPTGCGPSSSLPPEEQVKILKEDVAATIETCKSKFPSTAKDFSSAHAYAVYPAIGKGGLIVGGFSGKGLVYERGRLVARSDAGGGTIGAQIGGQSFSEVLFFKDKAAFEKFKRGETAFQAGGSATAGSASASAANDYKDGVMVLTFGGGGLMLEGVIGGQTFSYEPIK
jgi:lipid-binding SYLF domain-containing protein